MTPEIIMQSLFDQFIDTLTGGILTDIYTLMTFGVFIICVMLGLRYVAAALNSIAADKASDALYEKYNSPYGDKRVTAAEGRRENKRINKSMETWLQNNDPSESLRKKNY